MTRAVHSPFPPGSADPDAGDRVLRWVQPSGGRGLRTLSGRKAIGSACLPLVKAGGAYEVESGPELRFAMHATFDVGVVRMRSQPVRAEGVLQGLPFRYVVDAAVLRPDGTRELVEIKGSRRQLADPYVRGRLDVVAEAAAARGWALRVHVDEEDGPGPVARSNVERMFPCRLVVVAERAKAEAARILRRGRGATTLGELAAALDPSESRALATAYSMAARRMIDIDLTTRLGPRTVVRAVPPLPAVMPGLRF